MSISSPSSLVVRMCIHSSFKDKGAMWRGQEGGGAGERGEL